MKEGFISREDLERNIKFIEKKYNDEFENINENRGNDKTIEYYKDKDKCKNELKANISALFGESQKIDSEKEYKDDRIDEVGYSVIAKINVLEANKEKCATYIKFTLAYQYIDIEENKDLYKL